MELLTGHGTKNKISNHKKTGYGYTATALQTLNRKVVVGKVAVVDMKEFEARDRFVFTCGSFSKFCPVDS